jgi:uncharacterized RDD family membrane protein YckC
MSDPPVNPPPDGTDGPAPPPGTDPPPYGGAPGYGSTPGYGSAPPPYGSAPPPYGVPPGYPTGGYGPPPTGPGRPADLGVRFLARLIDFLVLLVVNVVVSLILVAGALGMNNGGFDSFGYGGSYAYNAVNGVIEAAIGLAYFALMESRTGQTLGKMLLGLRTQGPDGRPPALDVAVRRNFWVALGALAVVPGIGSTVGSLAELVIAIVIMVTISQSPVRQGWHDRFAGGTQVVRTG